MKMSLIGPPPASHGENSGSLLPVLDGGYCIGCGACAAASPGIELSVSGFGTYTPRLEAADSELLRDASSVCPFADGNPDEDAFASELFAADSLSYSPIVGHYRHLSAGFATTGDFRQGGSSGGLVTWLLCTLLERGLIDGVIHARPADPTVNEGMLFNYAISTTPADVQSGASSKYYPVEMSAVLQEVRERPGRYAFVGVPCFVKAIRLLQRREPLFAERITCCIGLVCGHLKSSRFAEALAWQCGVHPTELRSINFRRKLPGRPANDYGLEILAERHGSLEAVVRPMKGLLGKDWGHGLFKLRACDFCDDIFAETADVAIGDAWLPRFTPDTLGTSLLVTRNPMLDGLIQDGARRGELHLEPITETDAVRSQAANVRHRRDTLAYRQRVTRDGHEWAPAKRQHLLKATITEPEQRVQDLRMQISRRSHEAFREALLLNDVEEFGRRLAPLLDSYDLALRARGASAATPPHTTTSRLRSIAGRMSIRAFARIGAMRRSLGSATRVLLLPPTSPGSVGDEAVVTAFAQECRERGTGVTAIGYAHAQEWCHIEGIDRGISLRDYFMYGSRRDKLRFLSQVISHDRFIVAGTDVLDGKYSEKQSLSRIALMELAHRVGTPVEVLGISFNAAPSPACIDSLRRLSDSIRLRARDRVSQTRLEILLGHPVELTADVAFLLAPERASAAVTRATEWVRSRRDAGYIVLGVNINHLLLQLDDGMPVERLIDAYHDALIPMVRDRSASLLLIPHDCRGVHSDVDLCRRLHDRVAREFPDAVSMVEFPARASEIKAVAASLDVVLSGKMHLAIACLGSGVPVGCITYQDKFEGLMDHFGLADVLLPPSCCTVPGLLRRFVSELVARRQELRTQILQHLPMVHSLARGNVEAK